ncbi:MAG: leucine-rich repeat protein, partial [Opitutaceae bacterium]
MKTHLKFAHLIRKQRTLPCLFFLLWLPRLPAQTYDGFTFTTSGTNITITGYTGNGGAISVPATIPGVGTVTAIGPQAFYYETNLTSVVLPGNVASIGAEAFYSCTDL